MGLRIASTGSELRMRPLSGLRCKSGQVHYFNLETTWLATIISRQNWKRCIRIVGNVIIHQKEEALVLAVQRIEGERKEKLNRSSSENFVTAGTSTKFYE